MKTEEELEREARLSRLGSMGRDNQVVLDVLAEMKLVAGNEVDACAYPNLTNEARQYNSGRLAGVMDVEAHLRGVFGVSSHS